MVVGAALYFFVVKDPIPLDELDAGRDLHPLAAEAD